MKVEISGLRSPNLFANRIAPASLVDVAYVDEVIDHGLVRLTTDQALGDLTAEADRVWLIRQVEAALSSHGEPTTGLAYRFES
ncbi:hypothetical protein [Dyella sp. ASV21]|uniref:hypothetical protein n=1 Tax=Dyella sp. ASV21 TaxID=2795114 RepID=UPI0018ECD4B9|nr:hypothetical protein [Dyella sp. ASV21]